MFYPFASQIILLETIETGPKLLLVRLLQMLVGLDHVRRAPSVGCCLLTSKVRMPASGLPIEPAFQAAGRLFATLNRRAACASCASSTSEKDALSGRGAGG